MDKLAHQLKGVFYDHPRDKCVIMLNDRDYIGTESEFEAWALYNYSCKVDQGLNYYTEKANKS